MKFNETFAQSIYEKLNGLGLSVIQVDKKENVDILRVVTLNHVLVFVGGEGEPTLQIDPTQFSMVTQKAVVTGNKILVSLLPLVVGLCISDIYIGDGVFLEFEDETFSEFKNILTGSQAEKRISKAFVSTNYDEDTIKELANNALSSTLQEKVQNKAQQIMTSPTIQTQSQALVDSNGNAL